MFRFTIRDVLWLMVVVGLGCAWWIDRRQWNKERFELRGHVWGLEHQVKDRDVVMRVQRQMLESSRQSERELRDAARLRVEGELKHK